MYDSPSALTHKFTGKERDTESNLDYFGARFYSNTMGRFMSPDWSATPQPVPYADLTDPQTLNLYGYVRNNPLSHADADGHCCDFTDVADFLTGAANAYGSDNLFGAGRMEQNSAAGRIGAAFGDAAATVQGAGETIVGTGGEVVGVGLDATGVGAVLSVPVGAVSTGLILHGTATGMIGGANLIKDANQTSSGGGPKADQAPGVTSSGQATEQHGNKLGPSGEPQVNTTKSNTREAARNKALNEGSGAVEHRTPKQGDPHFHPTDNQGKKKPSSTHHEYPD